MYISTATLEMSANTILRTMTNLDIIVNNEQQYSSSDDFSSHI